MSAVVRMMMLRLARPKARVRELTPRDADKYRSILERTTPDDRYRRYFGHVDALDPELVTAAVAERDDRSALIAERWGRPLGVAEAVLLDGGRAEISIIVARDSRRCGVGYALLSRLIEDLRTRGYTDIVADSLGDNYEFEQLARSVGMRPESCQSGICTWHLGPAVPA